jgi:hypothetical protein
MQVDEMAKNVDYNAWAVTRESVKRWNLFRPHHKAVSNSVPAAHRSLKLLMSRHPIVLG